MTKAEQTAWRKESRDIIDLDYLEWVHTQHCIVCGASGIEAHHVEVIGMGGRNARDDHCVVPLCPNHHRGRFSPHGADSDKFYAKFPKYKLKAIASDLYGRYREGIEWMLEGGE